MNSSVYDPESSTGVNSIVPENYIYKVDNKEFKIVKRRILLLFITALFPLWTCLPVGITTDTLEVEEYLIKARELFYDNYEKAYEYAIEGLKQASPGKYSVERIGLLQIAAEIEYFYLNNSFVSISHLGEMRVLSDETGYKRGIPWFNLNVGNVYYYQNNFERAPEATLNGASGYNALNDYNAIRTNRGLNAASSVTLQNIYDERRRELCFEGNELWDLSRTGRSLDRREDEILITESDNIDIPFPDYRWAMPLPLNETVINKNLEQNPGYLD